MNLDAVLQDYGMDGKGTESAIPAGRALSTPRRLR
jgi:hypothetical protein